MWLACVILVGMGITSMSTNLQLAAHPQHWRQYDMVITYYNGVACLEQHLSVGQFYH